MLRWILCHLGLHQPLLASTYTRHEEMLQYDQPMREWASPATRHHYICARHECAWKLEYGDV